jgi:hypothetical protein
MGDPIPLLFLFDEAQAFQEISSEILLHQLKLVPFKSDPNTWFNLLFLFKLIRTAY